MLVSPSPVPFSYRPGPLYLSKALPYCISTEGREEAKGEDVPPTASAAQLWDCKEPEVETDPVEQQVAVLAVWGCMGLGPGLASESLGQDPAVLITA